MEKENQIFTGEFCGKEKLIKRIIKSSLPIRKTVETVETLIIGVNKLWD